MKGVQKVLILTQMQLKKKEFFTVTLDLNSLGSPIL